MWRVATSFFVYKFINLFYNGQNKDMFGDSSIRNRMRKRGIEYGKYSKEKFRKDGEIRVGICNRGCDGVWST